MSSFCTLEIKRDHAILSFGSDKQNALSTDLLNQLIEKIQSLDNNESIKLIVLHSSGEKTFCAGADLHELLSIASEQEGTAFFSLFARLILALRKSPHLVLVKVQGKAVGGALGIIAAADYAIASQDAQLRLSELINGIGPFVVGPAIVRKTGVAAFNQMTLNPGKWFDANWAIEKNLFNEIVAEQIDQAVLNKVNEIIGYNIPALREIKKMMWSAEPSWDELVYLRAAISGRLIVTYEAKTALAKIKPSK
jgi:methylglutaconyl-CoA hydratase